MLWIYLIAVVVLSSLTIFLIKEIHGYEDIIDMHLIFSIIAMFLTI
jgi:hypothetical protein